MDGPFPNVNPLSVLDNDLKFLLSNWLSFQFPYYIPLLKEGNNLKVIVGRIWVKGKLFYTMASYSSLKAKDRSTLWKAHAAGEENIIFVKIGGFIEAHGFWYNTLKKFFASVPELTKKDAHELLVVFNHQDNKPFPGPLCVFCYVLDLQRECKVQGIQLTKSESQPKGEEATEGGTISDISDKFTSDTLNLDLE